MTDFGTIRQLVDIRQAARMYGLEMNRAGVARCIFHGDKNPSMKMYRDSSYASFAALYIQLACTYQTLRSCTETHLHRGRI
ncbi:MAG: hypothetical protein IK990_08215 [Ruminiclostridium sp.]|nr:hypothetical protein [Ruminiclostridium sp.]